MGYVFLFRAYRADQGKWQTSDPLGYPDGWNNFAYVNNGVTIAIDWMGGIIKFATDGRLSNAEKKEAQDAMEALKKTKIGKEIVEKIEQTENVYIINLAIPDIRNGVNSDRNIYIDFGNIESYAEGDYVPTLNEILLHEFTHCVQLENNTWKTDPEGIWENEIEACKNENTYLKEIGDSRRRKIYDKKPLPASVWE